MKRFLNLFKRSVPPVSVVYGSYNGFTLTDWQRSDPHIKWARDMMGTGKFRDLLAVLSNARPHTHLPGITETEAAIALGRRLGYDEILGTLLSLANYPQRDDTPVEADYGAHEFDVSITR